MSTSTAVAESAPTPPADRNADVAEQRNLLVLILHQVFIRTAWIFKTESVIMPAFLDSISESGWVRGMLPPLNRFGQSLAPLLLSERLSRAPLKKRWLYRSTTLMGVPFLVLGLILHFNARPGLPFVVFFLTAYLAFFCVTGINQAAFNTIQGKLIRPQRRGRLVAIAGYIGSPLAVLMAWWLLRPWTAAQPPLFSRIFLFTGTVFLIAGVVSRWLVETPDPAQAKVALRMSSRLREARHHLKNDPHLRRLCVLASMFVCSQLLFPHYQRLGQTLNGFHGSELMVWVILQNLAAALFSFASGRVADRIGTRSALRWLTFAAMFAPATALVAAHLDSASAFCLTFVVLGSVPVTYRMFLNYALELTERGNHPIYVSTVVLAMAPPIVMSPLIGELVSRRGYVLPFLLITVALLSAWLLTLFIIEPRHHVDRKAPAPEKTAAGLNA